MCNDTLSAFKLPDAVITQEHRQCMLLYDRETLICMMENLVLKCRVEAMGGRLTTTVSCREVVTTSMLCDTQMQVMHKTTALIHD